MKDKKDIKETIKELKKSLKKDLKYFNLEKIVTGILGFGSLAVIGLNFIPGLLLFSTAGGLGFLASLGAYGITKFASAYRKASKLKKYEEHLNNELNAKRNKTIDKHDKNLAKSKKKIRILDKIQGGSMIASLAGMLLFPGAGIFLALPIVSTVCGLLRRKPNIDEADLDARIKCIQCDLDVATLQTQATNAAKAAAQKVATESKGKADSKTKTNNTGSNTTKGTPAFTSGPEDTSEPKTLRR